MKTIDNFVAEVAPTQLLSKRDEQTKAVTAHVVLMFRWTGEILFEFLSVGFYEMLNTTKIIDYAVKVKDFATPEHLRRGGSTEGLAHVISSRTKPFVALEVGRRVSDQRKCLQFFFWSWKVLTNRTGWRKSLTSFITFRDGKIANSINGTFHLIKQPKWTETLRREVNNSV
ncbi:MAG: hypothetical protein ACTS5P_00125 [Candidatus Hodgkinia cicadicola]